MSVEPERDPRVDPRAGDWLAGTGPSGKPQELRIDDVRNGEVYMAHFYTGEEEARNMKRMPLDAFQKAAQGSATVVWWAEQGKRFA